MKRLAAVAVLFALAVGTASANWPATASDVDLNADGRINSTDQLILSQHYTVLHSPDYESSFDFNGDQKTNSTDALIQAKCYGRTIDDTRLCLDGDPPDPTLAIRVAFIWPFGYQSTYTAAQGCAETYAVVGREQAFLASVGMYVRYDVRCLASEYSLDDLARKNDGTLNYDSCPYKSEGINENHVLELSTELGWDTDLIKFKFVYAIAGGGGIAGTTGYITSGGVGAGDQDIHYVRLGDWRIGYDVTGVPDQCCVFYYGPDFCAQPLDRPFTIETFNSFGADGDGNILHLPVMDGTYPPEQQRIDILLNAGNSYWREPW